MAIRSVCEIFPPPRLVTIIFAPRRSMAPLTLYESPPTETNLNVAGREVKIWAIREHVEP